MMPGSFRKQDEARLTGLRRVNGKQSQGAFRNDCKGPHRSMRNSGSKSQGHPDMARLKSQPLVKALGIDPGVMREQLDQLASAATRLRNRPLHQALADALAAAMGGDANVLEQTARCALRTQPRQD